DELASEVVEDMFVTSETDWREALRSGTRRYLAWWSDRPAFSRAYFVELPTAGTRAVEQRSRQYARFRELFEALAAWAQTELRPVTARAIVLAVTELIAEEVRAGRTDRLPEMEDDIVHLITSLLTAA